MDGHEGSAPSIPIRKVLEDGHYVCLSTPTPEEMEIYAKFEYLDTLGRMADGLRTIFISLLGKVFEASHIPSR